jgi:transposase
LEEAQRASKRQAAPFSRGQRKEHPQTPGRKPGSAYGQRSSKLPPQQVDEVISVSLPERCSCGGQVAFDRTESQYQQEIVRKTFWPRFDIAIGHCEECQKRWQGRDPRQTSDALGAAQVQLGPNALALAVEMNKGLGMPRADVAAVLRGRLSITSEPQHHLPGRGPRGATRRTHLARSAGCRPAQHGERHG